MKNILKVLSVTVPISLSVAAGCDYRKPPIDKITSYIVALVKHNCPKVFGQVNSDGGIVFTVSNRNDFFCAMNTVGGASEIPENGDCRIRNAKDPYGDDSGFVGVECFKIPDSPIK